MRKSETVCPLASQVHYRSHVRCRRRALCDLADQKAVGSSSATGAVYRPLSASRQQLSFGRCRFSRPSRNPGTATIICPLGRWVKLTAAVVLASFVNVAGSAVPVGRERSSIGDPPALQALFCGSVKLSVSSVEQVNLSPFLLTAPAASAALKPTESASESPAHLRKPGKLRFLHTPARRITSQHSPVFSSRYSVSTIRLQPRHPRSGASPDRRSKPGPAAVHPPAPASGGSGGQS